MYNISAPVKGMNTSPVTGYDLLQRQREVVNKSENGMAALIDFIASS